MRRYKYKEVIVWSSDLAYCIGLLVTDGSLSKDGRHIDLTSTDYETVDTYRRIIKPSAKIGRKFDSTGHTAFRVQISSTALYDFLLDIGLTPNKSKTIGVVAVPDEYFRDFLRGCFDGDGSTYAYWDTRWKNSFMYYVTFCSASPHFANWLLETNARLIPNAIGKLTDCRQSSRIIKVTYAKAASRLLFSYMYYDSELPKLTRKYRKLLEFIEKDPYA